MPCTDPGEPVFDVGCWRGNAVMGPDAFLKMNNVRLNSLLL